MPRPADRRAKIELLRAAEAVFVEHGLSAAKVEDITARAGVSKGAFYLHFESKEDCFRQIVEGFVAKLATCVGDARARAEGLDVGNLGELIAEWHAHDLEIFEFCWQNRGLMGILLTGGGGAEYGYLIDAFAERMAEQIEAWARKLIAAGIYRHDVDPAVLPALISGGYERLLREMIKRSKRPDIAAWARQAMGLYLRGLLTDEARAVVEAEIRQGPASDVVDREVRLSPEGGGAVAVAPPASSQARAAASMEPSHDGAASGPKPRALAEPTMELGVRER